MNRSTTIHAPSHNSRIFQSAGNLMSLEKMGIVRRNCIGWLVLCFVLVAGASGEARGFLRIKILDGDGAFNDIKRKTGHSMSVAVLDENSQPLLGAEVTFTAPSFGASGTFSNGKRVMTAITNMQGVAQVEPLLPNLTEGRFNIAVTARQGDREGTAVIVQANSTAIVVPRGSKK
jgi:hypothetical protein